MKLSAPPKSSSPWAAATPACPLFPGKRYEDRTLDDPAGKTIEEIRPIRDEIERRIRHLLDELDTPASL
jgi:protein-tyrosine-phosphatase